VYCAIDIDETIRAFVNQLTKVYRRELSDPKIEPNLTSYEMSTWFPFGGKIWDFVYKEHTNEIFEDAPLIEGALEMLIRLEAEGHEIQLVTAQPKTAIAPTINWIRKNKIPYSHIHFTTQKYRVFTNIFLDDCTENLISMFKRQPNALPIAIDRPWNQNWKRDRITKHSQIFDIIEMIKSFGKMDLHQRSEA